MLGVWIGPQGKNEVGSIAYWHPAYARSWWWWEFARVSYMGGQEYLEPTRLTTDFHRVVAGEKTTTLPDGGTVTEPDGERMVSSKVRSLLWRFERESDSEYANRSSRADYQNVYAPIINALVSHALTKGPSREGDDRLKEFWDLADEGRTRALDSIVREGIPWAMAQAVVYAVVDSDPAGDGKPYVYWVPRQDVLDWQCDEKGNFVWLKQFIYAEEPRTWLEEVRAIDRYRIWGRDEIVDFEVRGGKKAEEVKNSRRPNKLGRVPFVPLIVRRVIDSPHPEGAPWGIDLAKACQTIFNLDSQLTQIGLEQTFSQLCGPFGKGAKIEIGTTRAITIPQDSQADVKYIAPDPEQARVLMEMRGSKLEQVRQAAGVGRGRSESSKQQQSAEAMELEATGEKTILGDIAAAVEDFEYRLADLVGAYFKDRPKRPHIAYSRDFDLDSLDAELDRVLKWQQAKAPREVMVELMKQLVRQRFPQAPQEVIDRMMAAIDQSLQEQAEPPQEGKPGSNSLRALVRRALQEGGDRAAA